MLCLAGLLLIRFMVDVMDPFTPGVFSLEKDGFFVDGVVHVKSTALVPLIPISPTAPSIIRTRDAENTAATRMDAAWRLLRSRSRPSPWKHLKHDDSASFASSALPDEHPPQS